MIEFRKRNNINVFEPTICLDRWLKQNMITVSQMDYVFDEAPNVEVIRTASRPLRPIQTNTTNQKFRKAEAICRDICSRLAEMSQRDFNEHFALLRDLAGQIQLATNQVQQTNTQQPQQMNTIPTMSQVVQNAMNSSPIVRLVRIDTRQLTGNSIQANSLELSSYMIIQHILSGNIEIQQPSTASTSSTNQNQSISGGVVRTNRIQTRRMTTVTTVQTGHCSIYSLMILLWNLNLLNHKIFLFR